MKTFRFYATDDARYTMEMNDRGAYIEIDACKFETAVKRLYKHEKFEHGPYCVYRVKNEYDELEFCNCWEF